MDGTVVEIDRWLGAGVGANAAADPDAGDAEEGVPHGFTMAIPTMLRTTTAAITGGRIRRLPPGST